MGTPSYQRERLFLEQWIDGATVQSAWSERPGHDVITSGFAWQLNETCLILFENIIRELSKLPNRCIPDNVTLKECLSRLYLWGEGFGGGRLDNILQKSSALKGPVLEFLTAIAAILLQRLLPLIAISRRIDNILELTKELTGLVDKTRSILFEPFDDSSEDEYTDSASDDESEVVLKSDDTLPDIAKDINSYVSCLMGLLPSMERVLHFSDEEDASVLEPIDFHVSDAAWTYVHHIYDKFKYADSELISRLGEANFQRHFAVRQKMEILTGEENKREISEQESVHIPKSRFIPVSVFHDSGLGSFTADSEMARTQASHSSFKTDGSEWEKGGIFRVPEPPCDYGSGPFPCNICGHILKNIKNRYDWKIHVFADLQPYICTFSSCKDALLTFPTRKLWEEHEFTQHRVDRSWACPECDSSFSTTEEWKRHLQSNHRGNLSEIQVRYALASAQRVKPRSLSLQKCPLCLETTEPTRKNFTSHVCKHMESIALAALPNYSASDSEAESNLSSTCSVFSNEDPAGQTSYDCLVCVNGNIECDRQRPSCSQCLANGIECSSYNPQLTSAGEVPRMTSKVLGPDGDEYIPIEYDEAGEKKVTATGHLAGGRRYRTRTFSLLGRGDKLFMLATECCRVLDYRDIFLFFSKNPSLFKIIASMEQKEDLIQQEIIPVTDRPRQIAVVTAKSVFCQFGNRIIVNGCELLDDYWESKERERDSTKDQLTEEKGPATIVPRKMAAAVEYRRDSTKDSKKVKVTHRDGTTTYEYRVGRPEEHAPASREAYDYHKSSERQERRDKKHRSTRG